MTADDACELIGIPYLEGGNSLEGFNCWGLLRHIQREYFSTYVADAPIGDEDECLRIFKENVERKTWQSVGTPEHGDCVLLRGGSRPHVGVYLDIDGGGVIHALEGSGVVYTVTNHLRMLGFSSTKYYRIKSNEPIPVDTPRSISA